MMGNWLTRQNHPSTTVCDARHTSGTGTEASRFKDLPSVAAMRRRAGNLIASKA
jgi:hypothetical protein